uniref:Uncharacterized protein n=1 Tax=Salmonella phage vB_SEnST11_KE23 TaxID=3161174 RepID=A0AAU8GHF5_9CAUD
MHRWALKAILSVQGVGRFPAENEREKLSC